MIALVNVMCRVKAYYFRPDIIREYSQKVTELKKEGKSMDGVCVTREKVETTKDRQTVKDAKKMLLRCPICGAAAYLSKDIVDGYYFGYSVGCPRFRLRDGIHNIDENTPRNKRLSIFGLDSVEECIEKWNERVSNYERH